MKQGAGVIIVTHGRKLAASRPSHRYNAGRDMLGFHRPGSLWARRASLVSGVVFVRSFVCFSVRLLCLIACLARSRPCFLACEMIVFVVPSGTLFSFGTLNFRWALPFRHPDPE